MIIVNSWILLCIMQKQLQAVHLWNKTCISLCIILLQCGLTIVINNFVVRSRLTVVSREAKEEVP